MTVGKVSTEVPAAAVRASVNKVVRARAVRQRKVPTVYIWFILAIVFACCIQQASAGKNDGKSWEHKGWEHNRSGYDSRSRWEGSTSAFERGFSQGVAAVKSDGEQETKEKKKKKAEK